ncbi:MAG: hypothetical protein GF334_13870 [Candidatus Altiarchaeales archaeon]|nr:hypothetical protein [Candidatus Altiarchaeales archaeon]
MKTLLTATTLFCLLLFAVPVGAADVTLGWDDPGEPWGTRVYVGEESGNYQWSKDAGTGTVTVTVENLEPGKEYFFAAKHYDGGMESDFSNEVSHVVRSEITVLPNVPELDDSVKRYEITIRKVE